MLNYKRITKFLLMTFIPNIILVLLFIALEHFFQIKTKFPFSFTLLGILYMFVPLSAAIVVIKSEGQKITDYGLNIKFNPWWLLAWLIPILITVLTICSAVLLNFGELDLTFSAFLNDLRTQMGEKEFAKAQEQLKNVGPLLISLQTLLLGTTVNAVPAFGEEIGWRGFLFKELRPLGFWKMGLFIGAIWGIWHAPLILLGHNFPKHPFLGVWVMTAACIPLGILFNFIRLKSGSVLAAAIGHGVFNAFSGYTIIAVKGGSNILKSSVGIAGVAAMSLLVLVLWLIFKKQTVMPENKNNTGSD
jgi:membrane protease YdiL (CAAX protease family)